jgi:hypothetical protein
VHCAAAAVYISARKVWMIPISHDIKDSTHLNLWDNTCISYFSTLKFSFIKIDAMKAFIFNLGARWRCGFNIVLRPLYPGEGAPVPIV